MSSKQSKLRTLWVLAIVIGLGVAYLHHRDETKSERQATAPRDVRSLLDAFHRTAAQADEEAYFALFARDSVFLGTDQSERWSRDAFRRYAHPFFSKGKGWTYLPSERHVSFSRSGDVAWFDEKLTHEKYGVLRGTGVLVSEEGGWKVAQYNLTFTIPNGVAPEVVRVIKSADTL